VKTYYKKLKFPDGTTRDEHRVIMEQSLGRRLLTTEHVHHINGDKRDNRIENLQVLVRDEHARLHWDKEKMIGAATKRIKGQPNRSSRKLSDLQVAEVRSLIAGGTRLRLIAKAFSVHIETIKRIKQARSYVNN